MKREDSESTATPEKQDKLEFLKENSEFINEKIEFLRKKVSSCFIVKSLTNS